ncbi:hypothetical protein NEIRO03_1368 [Nematocida sp. AWRm78]|nr:hypothetical protein NEIRO03_1368 [Nematocida sp. AWRm78]
MGKTERKIAIKARMRIDESIAEKENKAKRTLAPKEEKKESKKSKAKEKEAEEKLKELEKKRPLKKALALAEKERKKEEARNSPPRRRGRPRIRPITEGPISKKKKKTLLEKEGASELKGKKETIETSADSATLENKAKNVKKVKKDVPKEIKIRKKKLSPSELVIEEVLNSPDKKEEIRDKICSLEVEGRKEEIIQLANYITESTRHTIYVYGKPGTGKTYVMEKIGQLLDEQGVEVYYSNLLIDKNFRKIGKSLSTTVLLIVDEFEGTKKDKLFIRQQEKLERLFRKEERKKFSFKVILVSNEYNSKGIQFKPYQENAIKDIVEKKEESGESKTDSIIKVHSGVEKADLRAIMSKKIDQITPSSNETLGKYHQFIKKQVQEGNTNINQIYSEFLKKMKENGVSVVPKEIVREIIEGYLDGTLT